MPDVIVIGGGVIGLSIAWELARHGLAVRILEQGMIGQESSWAGAGMLPPGNWACAKSTEARLRGATHDLWPQWSEELRSLTGLDNEFRRCGAFEIEFGAEGAESSALTDLVTRLHDEGICVETRDLSEIRQMLPILGPDVTAAFYLPDFGQVRNPRHLKTLQVGCSRYRVELVASTPVCGIQASGDRVHSVETPSGHHEAGEFVFASGAWSRELLSRIGIQLLIEPLKGQIVLLQSDIPPFQQVIQSGREYLVPRSDGRVLIGSTEERAGFDKRNSVEAIDGLIRFALRVAPSLGRARLERTWAGLRPYSAAGRPYIGRLPGYQNASVATGHFRDGLHLSPITAVLIRQLLLSQELTVPDAIVV